MEKKKFTFDSMMREALGGMGTSLSFTRRLMVRIETEIEMQRIARIERIIRISGITVGIITLLIVGLALGMTYDIIPAITIGGENIWTEHLNALIFSIKEAYIPKYIVGAFTLILAIVAFTALDKILKREYS